MSNRTTINNHIIASLKTINGLSSPYSSEYKFKTDVHQNVYVGLKFLDEINDFPAIYVVSPKETRTYNTRGTTEAIVDTHLRCYIYGEDVQKQAQNLIEDVEHVIYSIRFDNRLQVKDVILTNIMRDNGLLEPYGIVEIFLSTRFEILDF